MNKQGLELLEDLLVEELLSTIDNPEDTEYREMIKLTMSELSPIKLKSYIEDGI